MFNKHDKLMKSIDEQINEIDNKLSDLEKEEKEYSDSETKNVDKDLLYGTEGLLENTKQAIVKKRKFEIELLAKSKNISYEDAKDEYLSKLVNNQFTDTSENEITNKKSVNELSEDEVINLLIEKIENMSNDTEFTFSSLLNDIGANVEGKKILDIINKVYDELNNKGINIVSKYGKDAIIGLPQNIPLIKK